MSSWEKERVELFEKKQINTTANPRDGFFEVDITRVSPKLVKLKQHMDSRIVGQSKAIEHIVRAFQREKFRNPLLPIGAFLFAGPPGVGKTETAKEIARYIIGDTEIAPLVQIDCAQYAESHQISALIGSSAGYIGSDKSPLLSARNIKDPFIKTKRKLNSEFRKEYDKLQREWQNILSDDKNGQKVGNGNGDNGSLYLNYAACPNAHNDFEQKWGFKSVILFDEVEKADKALWHILLSILAEGRITLNSIGNEIVLFNNSVIVLTTNIGSHEIQRLMRDSAIGFKAKVKDDDERLDQKIYQEAKRALEKKFPPELLGRLKEDIVVFRHLHSDDYIKLVDAHLKKVRQRFYNSNVPLILFFTQKFKQALIEKGIDKQYRARVLGQKIEKYVVEPISIGVGSGQIYNCDNIMFDCINGKMKLYAKRAESVKAVLKKENFGIQ